MKEMVSLGIIVVAMVLISSSSIGITFAQIPSMNNTSTTAASDDNDTTTETANQLQSSSNSTTAQPRIIQHSMGESEITGTPERIVALDWSASENLIAMGVQPIAVSDLKGMKQYLRPEGLSPDIVDLGLAEAPNLEMILGLEPDLIFGTKLSHSELYDELSSIAPTIIYDNSPPLNGSLSHLEALEQNIILVADAINQHDKGVHIVDRLHAKYEEAAAIIEAAGLDGTKYVGGAVDPPYGDNTFSTLRFFDNSFFMSQMLSRIGLVNAVTEEYGLANWGMRQVGLEGLATVDGPDVHFFYIHAEGQDAFQNEWKDNPVWTNLEIARNGNMHPLGTLYVYGGPKQMEEMIDKVVAALTGVTVEQQQQQQQPISANQTSAVS